MLTVITVQARDQITIHQAGVQMQFILDTNRCSHLSTLARKEASGCRYSLQDMGVRIQVLDSVNTRADAGSCFDQETSGCRSTSETLTSTLIFGNENLHPQYSFRKRGPASGRLISERWTCIWTRVYGNEELDLDAHLCLGGVGSGHLHLVI